MAKSALVNIRNGNGERHTCLVIVFKVSSSRILSDTFTAYCLTPTKQKHIYSMLIRELQVPRWSGNYREDNIMEKFSQRPSNVAFVRLK